MAFKPFTLAPAAPRRVLPAVPVQPGANAQAMNFAQRSPWEVNQTPGIPPAVQSPPAIEFSDGIPSVEGVPLGEIEKPLHDFAHNTRTAGMPTSVIPVFDGSQFGDSIIIPVTFAALGEQIALARPNMTRVLLTIVSMFAAAGQNIFYAFDRTADNVSCIPIPPGGNRIYERAVPQGELHIWAPGAGTVIIEFMNVHMNYASSEL